MLYILYVQLLIVEQSTYFAGHGSPHPKQGCGTQIALNCATVCSSHCVQ